MFAFLQKFNWKYILAIIGLLILVFTMYYTNHLATELAKKEVREAELHVMASDLNASLGLNETVPPLVDRIIIRDDGTEGIPMITENEFGEFQGYFFGEEQDTCQAFLEEKVEEFLDDGKIPREGYGYAKYIYYFDTPLLKQIKLFPILQVLLIGFFIALGYYLLNMARTSEQNKVWAGMAKETAHQLGTPISAIMGWIENLKLVAEDQPDQMEIVAELNNDVKRLELIADRFSKIGSVPELEKTNVFEELDLAKEYMVIRSPKRVVFDFPRKHIPAHYVMINRHLFAWVIENLIRNALDAMDREGQISARVYQENRFVCIDLSDTGKGIPAGKLKKVFEPGFSTKQRGWGLGLSLAKRIIKEYHNGKIYVKSSKINEGTTFTIKLPQAT